MTIQLVCLLIVGVAVLFAAGVVRCRKSDRNTREVAESPTPHAQPELVANQPVAVSQEDICPEPVQKPDSEPLWMRVPSFEGQTVYIETLTDKFFLKLRDRENGIYDAVRVIKTNLRVVEDRFRMRFIGTVLTHSDMRNGMFVSGGCLRYRKMYAELEFEEALSSVVVRVLFSFDSSSQQAS